MDRNEAVLRELNLYPLWQRRGAPAPIESAAAAFHSVSSVPLGKPSGQPVEPSKAASPVAGDSVAGEQRAVVVPMGVADKSREQLIGELDWPQLKAMVRDCTACRLRAGCTQTVFGVGDEQAEWLFVGEGPGADEDAQGEPFVGQAGKLLDNMLLAIKLRRGKNVYIANIVKCRPPNNRAPERDEIATCLPYLQRQIALIKPKLIVALGKTAATALLGHDAALGSLRGRLHDFSGIPLIITYHPAYLLRSPMEKAKAWQDLCLAADAMQKVQE
ncbi:MAG: uracil-DNA glycosylase [Nitrosomonadales bacterium]|nr:uracil-DNA glycosylase [Nitrosomonadales bacterium]